MNKTKDCCRPSRHCRQSIATLNHVIVVVAVTSRLHSFRVTQQQDFNMEGTNNDCTNSYQESTLTSLLKRSIKAKEHSHSPYSKFRVGAALLTDTGEIIDGCNVENASYGLTICAERTALVKAVSMGFKKFPAIAITTDMEEFIAPCGACRQVLAEFGLECDVYLVKSDLSYKKLSVSELLPMAFTSEDLERASLNK